MIRGKWGLVVAAMLGSGAPAFGATIYGESPKTGMFELKLGSYQPIYTREIGTDGQPLSQLFRDKFNGGSMLVFEASYDFQFFQRMGSLAVGLAAGYGEKYGAARLVGSTEPAPERSSVHVVPFKLQLTYRFDYAALHWKVPLVPYGKVGPALVPWWINKGGSVEVVDGIRMQGAKWGYTLVGGLSLMLDFLEPRMARDFDTGLGVNHSYLFAEYNYLNANSFSSTGLDFSSGYFLFGLGLEF